VEVWSKWEIKMEKTDWFVTVLPDGSEWGIPLSLIAENKAQYYAQVDNMSFEEALEETYKVFEEFEYEIEDWATNNMNWSDVQSQAVLLRAANAEIDFQEAWVNGEHFLTDAPEVIRG
jgi:hypothetical protein